ncbi:MAG TPA: NADPH:quinone oxidoreductase family protein [Candidatus Elarobacter sp.]|jgi:NADPH2:quinone reductase|nr:NADPH:quinone oxidoreductase family protein [Candidatus Elarobacter sp.]
MQAILCRAYGPPETLVMDEAPDPHAGPGQIVIDVHAAGLNFPDVLLIQGKYQVKPPLPFSPGVEVAGVVAEVGEGVRDLHAGDRVAAGVSGGFAEKAVANAATAILLPDTVGFITAAGMVLTYGTAYHALVDRAKLHGGEWLFVSGAGGGVGTASCDLAKALYAHAIASASSPAKRDAAERAGAEVVLDAGAPDLVDAIKSASGGGIDVAIDNVGGEQFDAALRAAKRDARLLVVGFAGGTIPQIPANRILLKELDVLGVYWGDWTARNPERNRANFTAMFDLIAAGKLHPRVDTTYAFADAPRAIADLMERRLVGKGVVRVRD